MPPQCTCPACTKPSFDVRGPLYPCSNMGKKRGKNLAMKNSSSLGSIIFSQATATSSGPRSHRKYWEDIKAGRVAKKEAAAAEAPAEEPLQEAGSSQSPPEALNEQKHEEKNEEVVAEPMPARAAKKRAKTSKARPTTSRGKRTRRVCQTARKNTTTRPSTAIAGRLSNRVLVGNKRTMHLYSTLYGYLKPAKQNVKARGLAPSNITPRSE